MKRRVTRVKKFIDLKFDGKWERSVLEGNATTVQYKALSDPHIPSITVVSLADDQTSVSNDYQIGMNEIVLVVGDIVHIPEREVD